MPLIPLWAAMAFGAALCATAVPLIQEKYKVEGFSLSLWVKIFLALVLAPLVLRHALPADPLFYLYNAVTCLIYSISDVVYYRAVPKIGSGVMTRLLPISVVMTFFGWFLVDPSQLALYAAQPVKAGVIVLILIAFVFFAGRVRKCTTSWQGVRLIWPVIVAACIGPIFVKLSLQHFQHDQATLTFVFFQALMMIVCLSTYHAIKRPVPTPILLSPHTIRASAILAVAVSASVLLKIESFHLVDNPGLASMIFFSDALFVLLIYKLIGRKEQANIWAGLGIVLCAAAVVVVKSWR